MKDQPTVVLLFVLAMFVAVPSSSSKESPIVLRGSIEDSQCALSAHAQGRSHDMMIKAGIGGTNEKTCTLRCVKQMGGEYVLAVKDTVYKLDDQVQPEKLAGDKVKVTATLLDAKTNTLHVLSIEEDH